MIHLPVAIAPAPTTAIAAAAAFKPTTSVSLAMSPAFFRPPTRLSNFSLFSFLTSSLDSFSSRSILFNSALALLSCIFQAKVLLSFSPKEMAALARAFSKVETLSFCASISLLSCLFLAVIDCIDFSFLPNSEDTSFISEPSNLKF